MNAAVPSRHADGLVISTAVAALMLAKMTCLVAVAVAITAAVIRIPVVAASMVAEVTMDQVAELAI